MGDKVKGLLKAVKLSSQMASFMNKSEASRAEMVKVIWNHIKANNLQVTDNKRMIKVDDKLKTIFPDYTQIGMFQIPKEISKHVIKDNK